MANSSKLWKVTTSPGNNEGTRPHLVESPTGTNQYTEGGNGLIQPISSDTEEK